LTISSTASDLAPGRATEESRFRAIFRQVHARHPACLADEWLMMPCAAADGRPAARPIVWSRRNGAWRRSPVLWVGAAPGNAGGLGRGSRGAHGTRIPFGGDVAGGNLDVLLASIGLDRDRTFLTAALNQLPARGGGEPTSAELAAQVGSLPSSVHLLRETLLAVGPRLVVALGNVALRTTIGAAMLDAGRRPRPRGWSGLPSLPRLAAAGITRGVAVEWPAAEPADDAFLAAWRAAWGSAPLPALLLCFHPSAQNMSPFAGEGTLFHQRMVETRAALRAAATAVFGQPEVILDTHPADTRQGGVESGSIYALPEWRESIEPYHRRLHALWRERGVG
jgi:uracil-DNA glycosylase